MVAGLLELHRGGITHGDIQAANLMVMSATDMTACWALCI
jgi:tRNA A-37 threonylcarbamoyl transferase component Bud32